MKICNDLQDFGGLDFNAIFNSNTPKEVLEEAEKKCHNPLIMLAIFGREKETDHLDDEFEILKYVHEKRKEQDLTSEDKFILAYILEQFNCFNFTNEAFFLFSELKFNQIKNFDYLYYLIKVFKNELNDDFGYIARQKFDKVFNIAINLFKDDFSKIKTIVKLLPDNRKDEGAKILLSYAKTDNFDLENTIKIINSMEEAKSRKSNKSIFPFIYKNYNKSKAPEIKNLLFKKYSEGTVIIQRDIDLFNKAIEIDKEVSDFRYNLDLCFSDGYENLFYNTKLYSTVMRTVDFYLPLIGEAPKDRVNPYLFYLAARILFAGFGMPNSNEAIDTVFELRWELIDKAIEQNDKVSDFYIWRAIINSDDDGDDPVNDALKAIELDDKNYLAYWFLYNRANSGCGNESYKEYLEKADADDFFKGNFYAN